MKIAVVTDNGTTISNHFGRARHYMVITVEDSAIVSQEMRDKQQCHGHGHGHGHSHDHGDMTLHNHAHSDQEQTTTATHTDHQHDHHHDVVSLIADCDVVMARGMGNGMHQRLQAANIRPILTTIGIIETAVIAYIEGRLKEHPELVH